MSPRCLVVLSGLALWLSACGRPRCTADAQCGAGQTCAPSGVCFSACAADADCGPGETCGPARACVGPSSGCAVTADCPRGLVCVQGGTCMATSTAGDAGGATCGGEKFEAQPTEANVLIVLDRSCSMQEPISPTESKWTTATGAVRRMTAQSAGGVRFGLQQFSNASQRCAPGQVDVPVGANTVAAISSALPTNADGAMTPIGAALRVAATSGQLDDPTRANFVLLITDGIENCGGAPVGEVQGLFLRNVKTYAVGFGDAVDGQRLNDMAIRGGTARATEPRFFQADNPADLEAALRAVSAGATRCDYRLAQAPPEASKLHVAVDGQFFPRDPSRTAGWDYDAAGNRITLFGPACDLLTQRPGAKVSVVYGCPDDTLVETGPGGRLDAGLVGWTGAGGFPTLPGAGSAGDAGLPDIN